MYQQRCSTNICQGRYSTNIPLAKDRKTKLLVGVTDPDWLLKHCPKSFKVDSTQYLIHSAITDYKQSVLYPSMFKLSPSDKYLVYVIYKNDLQTHVDLLSTLLQRNADHDFSFNLLGWQRSGMCSELQWPARADNWALSSAFKVGNLLSLQPGNPQRPGRGW